MLLKREQRRRGRTGPIAIAVLLGGQGFRFRWSAWLRVEARIGRLVSAARTFFADHIKPGIPPAPTGEDGDRHIIARLFPTIRDFELELPDDAVPHVYCEGFHRL